ncbi:hypothetical protein DPX16_8933 [Anabarilius grahami]|uniref:Uncharacterized protein n=1 Tax=Anabarilius grahami TaxID=495550 RepID=A0A3N0ZAH1_ANAGA|nr:hypothetical protein DPX16_8933 [Anabarilius grahami]
MASMLPCQIEPESDPDSSNDEEGQAEPLQARFLKDVYECRAIWFSPLSIPAKPLVTFRFQVLPSRCPLRDHCLGYRLSYLSLSLSLRTEEYPGGVAYLF